MGSGRDKTAGPGWAGLAGAPWVRTLPSTSPGTQAAPLAPHIANSSPCLPSAMAVESFTATAPFVQIGRFFLSAGKSRAIR